MAQIIVALCVSVLVSILLTPVLIKKFRQRDIRQEIREDGPQTHLVKAGTPTMGVWQSLLVFGRGTFPAS